MADNLHPSEADLIDICDQFMLINDLIEVAFMASTHGSIKRQSAMASFLDLVSGKLKQARCQLDEYRKGLPKRPSKRSGASKFNRRRHPRRNS